MSLLGDWSFSFAMRYLKNISLFVFGFSTFLLSCENPQEEVVNEETLTIIDGCLPYFNFDEIEHYSLTISPDEEDALFDKIGANDISEEEKMLTEIVYLDTFFELTEPSIDEKLQSYSFHKKRLSNASLISLDSLNCIKRPLYQTMSAYSCIPVFHDVLVFKRENIIVGAAKICFSCQKRVFFGESFSDDALQREIEYERLKEILKNN
jgi:hypothetical protein